MPVTVVDVIVDLPAHSQVEGALSYTSTQPVVEGALVRVPLGKTQVMGIVWQVLPVSDSEVLSPELTDEPSSGSFKMRPIVEILGMVPALDAHWMALVAFTAQYYQRSLGEVALQALPPALRKLDSVQLLRRLKKLEKPSVANPTSATEAQQEQVPSHLILPELTAEQNAVLGQLAPYLSVCVSVKTSYIEEKSAQPFKVPAKAPVFLLQGATGSGKTEVYMRAAQTVLENDAQAQVLILVPEINLTPQLQARFEERFPAHRIVSMHSGMTSAQRLQAWLLAHTGQARIVLGTRMAVFASMPGLKLIVVDEEHDPSYKQYEGARWSARDLAIWRGWREGFVVMLGSATPSLESWLHAKQGRYKLLTMPTRVGGGVMPKVRIVDMQQVPRGMLLAPALVRAMQERLDRGEQSMVLLNRRGYAPVLHCTSCGWQTQCPNCSAWRVFHRVDRSLRCHHCGMTEPVPRVCPECGDPDLQPIGKGTERLEEQLKEVFVRPDGSPAHVLRIDADSTRQAGSLVEQLTQVHHGEVDILVGTQMIAKGHDFRRVTLVAAVNPDMALFSSDFRSGERLFSLLMQAAGRGGRDALLAGQSELWIQTQQAAHPLFKALKGYDFEAFANASLEEREMAAMPPYMHLALVRVEARTQEAGQEFLAHIHAQGLALLEDMGLSERLMLYPPIPAAMQRIANLERLQMLLESSSRQVLQRFLAAWRPVLHETRVRGVVRWAIDVDPQSV